ncbi:hypothetical protein [Azospirillum doebereinerae]|uniref:DUF3311 domain-containing protein n=1 Tax=Azospirillum doebereinerae TaxID=92933 RepID=A0A3S0WP79_9PROT|nr:hypothetical protein [Azospirillum doebereinerae]MCG5239183.1 hypothetical protein [Azospirillum doebereinerae]RUQ75050.1 hypothetical protein EJ913_04105 [Azospirillum doebereinerae]
MTARRGSREDGKPPRRDRMVALFLLGLLLFNPPLLRLFGVEGEIFGVPVLYAYILGVWAAMIALAALAAERR